MQIWNIFEMLRRLIAACRLLLRINTNIFFLGNENRGIKKLITTWRFTLHAHGVSVQRRFSMQIASKVELSPTFLISKPEGATRGHNYILHRHSHLTQTSLDFCNSLTSRRDSPSSASRPLIFTLRSWMRSICSLLTLDERHQANENWNMQLPREWLILFCSTWGWAVT